MERAARPVQVIYLNGAFGCFYCSLQTRLQLALKSLQKNSYSIIVRVMGPILHVLQQENSWALKPGVPVIVSTSAHSCMRRRSHSDHFSLTVRD